jgi:hypothetical protein
MLPKKKKMQYILFSRSHIRKNSIIYSSKIFANHRIQRGRRNATLTQMLGTSITISDIEADE